MNVNLLEWYTESNKIRQILPHQIAIIDFILNQYENTNDGILLYAKPGTGKTLIGIISALILSNKYKILLLMPSENILTLWKNNIGIALTLIDNNYNMNNVELISMHNFISMITTNNEINLNNGELYRNHLIIIDEAHNILSNNQYEILIELKRLYNNTIILLSGSPINNTVETLPNLLSLIMDENIIDKDIVSTNNKVFEIKIKEEKLDQLRKICKNKISFYETPKNLLPKVIYEGELCSISYKGIICEMSNEHYKIYEQAKNITKNEIFEKILMNVSLFGINNIYISEDLSKLQIKEYRKGLSYNGLYFIGNELNNLPYAPKIKKMLEYLKLFGKHFIFFSNASYGSLIIKSVLKYIGYIEYTFGSTYQFTDKSICYKCYKDKSCKQCIVATFIVLTGQNITQINDYLDIYNNRNNDDGKVIKFIFGSNVLSEAYTLKETNYVHYLTVPDNETQKEQINGRAIRKFAFKNLNAIVKIYLYVAVEPNYYKSKIYKLQTYREFLNNIDDIVSYDLKKLIYIDLKHYETNKILNVFKDSSVPYRAVCNKNLINIVILNKLREIFYDNCRVKINSLSKLYNSKIFNYDKNEFFKNVSSIINNHPYVINKHFNLSLLYNINNEIITIPFSCNYGILYNSIYMKNEVTKVDINKTKNEIYIIIDRDISIDYNGSRINIKSHTYDTLLEIALKLKIDIKKDVKYFKQDLIDLIIEKLKYLQSKNKNIIYVIYNITN